MKRYFLLSLCVAAACWSLSSCKRENPEPGPDGPDQQESQEMVFWDVVGQLIDYRDITPDYQGKTFKAIVGTPDGGDESVRVIALNSPDAAAQHFNTLTGSSITATTASYTWQNAAVGSLRWQLNSDNTAWATVDVNIPQVPTLRKLIYRGPEQGDVNGSVGNNGSAYYRFGDVIQRRRPEDGAYEYWICVRPSFGPEKKGDSHWVCVSPLPESNIWPYNSTDTDQHGKPWKASNHMYYGLPNGIRNNTRWLQDLSELLFAIMYPQKWYNNVWEYSNTLVVVGTPTGLPIFYDFHYTTSKYHNEAFWTNVQRQWREKNLVELLFGISYDEMSAALNPDNANARGLHLLYRGYSWSVRTSNWPTLYEAHYTNGTGEKQHNMHKETTRSVSAQVVVPNTFDENEHNFPLNVHDLTSARPYLVEPRFFGDNHPRWIVRFASGEELSTTKRFDPQQPIPGFNMLTDEIYRYYRDVYPDKNLTDAPEVTDDTGGHGYVGRPHYRWGDIYKDEQGRKWMVINQAGLHYEDDGYQEHSRYSELVSFDSLGFRQYTPNGARKPSKVTNLPPLDVAIRATALIWLVYNNVLVRTTQQELEDSDQFGLTTLNFLEHAGVDLRTLLQAIWAQNLNPRASSHAACVAYDSDGEKQALFRFVQNIQNERNDPQFYIWTQYPLTPDLTTQFQVNFRPRTIYLQDIADQASVNDLAPDTYAIQALMNWTLPGSTEANIRPIRTQADEKANDVRKYFYDQEIFRAVQYPGSMWNEPILFFRYTRVEDRGDNDYSEKTVDGHKLTLFHERNWRANMNYHYDDDLYYNHVRRYNALFYSTMDSQSMYLNGQPYKIVRWDDIRDEDLQH